MYAYVHAYTRTRAKEIFKIKKREEKFGWQNHRSTRKPFNKNYSPLRHQKKRTKFLKKDGRCFLCNAISLLHHCRGDQNM